MNHKTVIFSGRPYTVGNVYEYEDLPPTAQEDARNSSSTEEDIEGWDTAKEYVYEFVIIPFRQAKKTADKISKEIKISDWTIGRAEELREDIELNGLGSPPTGAEGFHRVLALVMMGSDVPYFRMIEKKTGRRLGGAFW